MNFYFLPYFLLACVLFLLYLVESGRVKLCSKKTAIWTAYIIMWLFIGLRGHIMSDFIGYYPFFESMPDLIGLSAVDFVLRREEPGFVIYTSIIKSFTDNYYAWVAINTLIDLAVLAWFFHRYCKSMILPFIFFIAFNGLLMEFNLYRNMKAIELFLLSVPYLQDRKVLPYMLLNILGITFHTSSLLYIPLYWILTIRMSLLVVWIGFIISNIVFLLQISVIGDIVNNLSFMQALDAYDKIVNYTSRGETYGISFGYLERAFTFILFFSFYRKTIQKDSIYIIFYNCFWIYYCSGLIFYEVTVFTERVPYLFMFSYWIIYPMITEVRYYMRNLTNMLVSILVFMKIIASYNSPAGAYSNIIFGLPNYEERKSIVEYEASKN